MWMEISNAPTGDATVTLSAPTSTATEGTDFDFTTNGSFSSSSSTLTFSDGSTDSKSFTLRVYDDPYEDGSQDIVFQYSISGTTDAIAGSTNQTCTITVNDDDGTPSATQTVYLLQEDFESGFGGWSGITFGGHDGTTNNTWRIGTQNSINNQSAYVSEGSGSASYDNTKANFIGLKSPLIDATLYSELDFSFNYICNGESGVDRGMLAYQLDGSGSVTIFDGYYQNVTSSTARSPALPVAVQNQKFYLIWIWECNNNSAGSNPALVIDDIEVSTTTAGESIESTLNASAEAYLGPNATVHFYNESSGELMASIENLSAHDYGCTTVTIDRQGSSASESWNSGSSSQLADKTIRIAPTTNNASGAYNITLYYTSVEIDGWKTATSKDTSDIEIAKTSSSMADVTASTPGTNNALGSPAAVASFGTDYKITAGFTTGFSGFGVGDPGSPPPEALPVDLMTFKGSSIQHDVILQWTTVSEINTDFFRIERSVDGIEFEGIGAKKAFNEGEVIRNYAYTDRALAANHYYYRLKMIDFDGSFEYSDVISIEHGFDAPVSMTLFPNPATDMLNVEISNKLAGRMDMKILDIGGRVIKTQRWLSTRGLNRKSIDLKGLKQGIYFLQLENDDLNQQLKFIIN